MRYAIIGFGCAGYHAARAIRAQDPTGEIHVFESEQHPPANPMLTTYYAGGKLAEQHRFPFGSLETVRDELSLYLHMGQAVRRLDTAQRCVYTEDGEEFRTDRVLISTGAYPFVPGIEGLPDPRVYTMRTVADAELLKQRLAQAPVRKAVVVGASMVGIKVAELLWKAGAEVTIADAAKFLFPLAAFESTARIMERQLEVRGYRFLWGAGLTGITPEGVKFADGTELEADLICLCIGVRPNLKLIQGQEIPVNRGIVVDAHQQTGCPGVYAAGDCCEALEVQSGGTQIVGLWANAGVQGRVAGTTMAGGTEVFPGGLLHNITHFMDMDFIGLGDTRKTGEHIRFENPNKNIYIDAVIDNGRLQCVNLLGNYGISGILKSYFLKQLTEQEPTPLPAAQKAILLRAGMDEQFLSRIGG